MFSRKAGGRSLLPGRWGRFMFDPRGSALKETCAGNDAQMYKMR